MDDCVEEVPNIFVVPVVEYLCPVESLGLEDWHEEIHYDLATEVIRAIKSGQFNPHKDMVQSMLVGDPFQERYNFDSVTPANEGYLQQICDLFSGPWATPQDVVDEMKDL